MTMELIVFVAYKLNSSIDNDLRWGQRFTDRLHRCVQSWYSSATARHWYLPPRWTVTDNSWVARGDATRCAYLRYLYGSKRQLTLGVWWVAAALTVLLWLSHSRLGRLSRMSESQFLCSTCSAEQGPHTFRAPHMQKTKNSDFCYCQIIKYTSKMRKTTQSKQINTHNCPMWVPLLWYPFHEDSTPNQP